MVRHVLLLAVALAAPPASALAQTPWDLGKKAAGGAAVGKLEKEINRRLLDESRKNQCSFKTDSDVLAPGCDAKAKRLATAVLDAKKRLNAAGVENFTFEVGGHTDSSGNASHNKALSEKRAEAIKRELVRKGVPEKEVVAVGHGAEKLLVKPDDTPAKKAKNRRYEIQVRL
jgi:outer membrane protein OmpA-like peptidoglycan-associated protein